MSLVTPAEKNTPLMEQYFAVKEQYPGTLLLFQVGDFYELFFDDAKTASSYLALTLTKRGKNKGEDVPLCGIPVHALQHYLTKLVRGGYRVAICDQLTKPAPGTVVQRGVTQVFTPGTLTDTALLDEKSASYLLSFYPLDDRWGLVFSEILTAQIFATSIPADAKRAVEAELIRFFPDEVLLPPVKNHGAFENYFKGMGYCTSLTMQAVPSSTSLEGWGEHTQQKLAEQPAISASVEQLFAYLKKNQERSLEHFKTIHFYEPDDYLVLDPATQKNLELFAPPLALNLSKGANRKHTLFAVMDCARTAMGSRTIKKWLSRPLVQKTGIEQRLDMVEAIATQIDVLQKLERLFTPLADLERIIGRIALGRATLPDYLALKQSLVLVPEIKEVLAAVRTHSTTPQEGLRSGRTELSIANNTNKQEQIQYEEDKKNAVRPERSEAFMPNEVERVRTASSPTLAATLADKMIDFTALLSLLEASLNDNPAMPGTIKQGFDFELDRLRNLLTGGKQAIITMENEEIAATGIASLKIGYTDISGYYIEVTNPNLSKVPERYQHKQTLVNRKRFITTELKNLEADLFKAQNELDAVEAEAFDRVKKEVAAYLAPLRQLAQSLAYLDGLYGFAHLAYHNNYVRPNFNDKRTITITDGRHPVVEEALGPAFIPNDTELHDQQSLLIITGPNMGGKSTYLRQVALMSIMAQCGSFVPAHQANLPILDRVFTRIGAGDNVAEGKSTFLVEMEETATICTQATQHSLVILDEVGRGTSTFDGMALAQAIIEYIALKLGSRCLFATHYHELTHLSERIGVIANYHADCKKGTYKDSIPCVPPGTPLADSKKAADNLIFLHKIVRGVAPGSFGVEVAKLAQVPEAITLRAAELLEGMESGNNILQGGAGGNGPHQSIMQPDSLTTANDLQSKKYTTLISRIKDIDFDTLSPRAAFDLLWELKKEL